MTSAHPVKKAVSVANRFMPLLDFGGRVGVTFSFVVGVYPSDFFAVAPLDPFNGGAVVRWEKSRGEEIMFRVNGNGM